VVNTLRTPAFRRRILSSVVAMALTGAVLASSSYAAAPAGEGSADSKRIVAILKETAVQQHEIAPGTRLDKLFADDRVKNNPKQWQAVNLKTASLIRDLESRHRFSSILAFGHLNHGLAATLSASQIEALKSDPAVEAVFEDIPGQLASQAAAPWSNTPDAVVPALPSTAYTTGWNLHAIGLYNASSSDSPWYRTNGETAAGAYPVKTYIIDDGIQPHADLNFNWQVDHISFDCHSNVGGSCVDAGPNLYVWGNACDSHATSVAGVVGAIRQNPAKGVEGVAPGAQLVSVKVTNACSFDTSSPNNSGTVYTSGVLAAINWIGSSVPNNGVDQNGRRRLSGVANISILWAYQTYGQTRYSIPPEAQTALRSAIQSAVAKGVFFTFAAGNSNEPACNLFPAAIGYDTAGAMAVGALQQNGQPMQKAGGVPMASSGQCVEIWAPGQDVHSTGAWPGDPWPKQDFHWGAGVPDGAFYAGQHYYYPSSGSSLAAPHAAGAALLLANKYQRQGLPLPAPADIESLIQAQRQSMNYQWNPLNWNIGNTWVNLLRVDRF
jgi:subtilisin family serine protease